MKFYDEGRREQGFERGVESALRAILVSPKFLIRVEKDPSTSVRRSEPSGSPAGLDPVSDIDLASRLSFFLWSSIPDD